jgi:hypothetical protein
MRVRRGRPQRRGHAGTAVPAGRSRPHQGAKGVGDRRVRHTLIDARSEEHRRLPGDGTGELVDEPRLADARFSRDQHGHRLAGASRAKCDVEACSLAGPADQDWARRPPQHGDILPPRHTADRFENMAPTGRRRGGRPVGCDPRRWLLQHGPVRSQTVSPRSMRGVRTAPALWRSRVEFRSCKRSR